MSPSVSETSAPATTASASQRTVGDGVTGSTFVPAIALVPTRSALRRFMPGAGFAPARPRRGQLILSQPRIASFATPASLRLEAGRERIRLRDVLRRLPVDNRNLLMLLQRHGHGVLVVWLPVHIEVERRPAL